MGFQYMVASIGSPLKKTKILPKKNQDSPLKKSRFSLKKTKILP